jgi:hypothetical protein
MQASTAEQIALLAKVYARPQREVQAPAIALLGLRRIEGRVEVTVEAPGCRPETFNVTDAADARLAGLRATDRRHVADLIAGEVR